MNLKQLIKQKRSEYPKKMKTLLRIKVGRVLGIIAALPLCTSPLFILSIPMMLPIKPSLWSKDKLREIKLKWQLH